MSCRNRATLVLSSVFLACIGLGYAYGAKRAPQIDVSALTRALESDPLPGQLSWFELEFDPFVFGGANFPSPNFKKPSTVERIFGKPTISTAYYDADFNEVKVAAKSGRYGAVSKIRFATGLQLERYYTLYKYPGDLKGDAWWLWASRQKGDFQISMPPELGIQRDTEGTYAQDISRFVRFGFYQDMLSRPYAARLMASLYEVQSLKISGEDLINRDRQWWVTMKQKLYPTGLSARSLRGPQRLAQASAEPMAGPPNAADLPEDLINQLDDIFKQWSSQTGTGFTAAVARRGVLFFNRAYGQQDGAPVTLSTRSHLASISKALTGIAVTMLLDQKALSLDDNISKYLPELKDELDAKPITLRQLLTHTSGLPNLTLDELNDLEEVLRIFIPQVRVGEKYVYSETGYSLAGKIIERITGMTVPDFYTKNIIEPLGLRDFDVRGAASDAHSNAQDLAKIGQFILNKGSLGTTRLFETTSSQLMIPSFTGKSGYGAGLHRISLILAGGAAEKTTSMPGDQSNQNLGFGSIVGHGSSSGSILFIDLDNQLVVALTKSKPNPRDFEFRNQLVKTLGQAISSSLARQPSQRQ